MSDHIVLRKTLSTQGLFGLFTAKADMFAAKRNDYENTGTMLIHSSKTNMSCTFSHVFKATHSHPFWYRFNILMLSRGIPHTCRD